MSVNWDLPIAATIPLPIPAAPTAELDRAKLLLDWETAKSTLESAKAHEMDLRKKVSAGYFPTPDVGTQRVPLANDYQLKLVHKVTFDLGDKEAIEAALVKIEAIGNEGPFVAKRLIKWTPSLVKSEYDALKDDASTSASSLMMLQHIDEVITVKPGAPTLEIEAPKTKKGSK